MKEVEVKIQINKDNREEIEDKLSKLGFERDGKEIKQTDDIFLKNGTDFNMVIKGANVLRIRTIDGKIHTFTVKQRTERILAALEAETNIKDKKQIEIAIKLLGYYKIVSVQKIRQKYKKGNMTICIDKVASLGDFIEVERIVDEDVDSGTLQGDLMKFAIEKLGVKDADRINNSYDVMTYDKLNKQQRNITENYAFIDGQNLYKGLSRLGKSINYEAFRIYLKEVFGVSKAIVFMGFLPKYQNIYDYYEKCGFEIFFKDVAKGSDGEPKGNVYAEIVVEAALNKFNDYKRAVIISSDGDYAYLVKSLKGRGKFLAVISPEEDKCSKLLKRAVGGRITYLENIIDKLQLKKRA